MGFSTHPGSLPFETIRRQQWGNRLAINENIEIHGEHGCSLPVQAAKVVSIREYKQPAPPHLASVYAGQQLVAILLTHTDEPWRKVGESWEKI